MTDRDFKTLSTMNQHGGAFVQALAIAAFKADPDNLKRIKDAFSDLWAKYETYTPRHKKP